MNTKLTNEQIIAEEMYSEFESFIENNTSIVEEQAEFEINLNSEPQYYIPLFY